MNISNKIQCPTCGASSFKELEPSLLKCDYCTTTWEHQSIVAHKSVDNTLYDQIIKLYDDHIKLLPEAPKYHERILSAAYGMEALCNEVTNEKIKQEVSQKTTELIEKEIALLNEKGIQVNSNKQELIEKDDGSYLLWNSLQYYYILLASLISKQTDEEAELKRALKYLQQAEKVKEVTIDSYDKEFSARKVGLFQRLGMHDSTYAYLFAIQHCNTIEKYKIENDVPAKEEMDEWDERELKRFEKDLKEHQEQVAYDFEDILFSEEYLAWKAKHEQQLVKNKPKVGMTKEAQQKDAPPLREEKPAEEKKPSFFERIFGS